MAKRKCFVILYNICQSVWPFIFRVEPSAASGLAGGQSTGERSFVYIYMCVCILLYMYRGSLCKSFLTRRTFSSIYKRKRRRWTWQVGVAIIAAAVALLCRGALEGRVRYIWKKKSSDSLSLQRDTRHGWLVFIFIYYTIYSLGYIHL